MTGAPASFPRGRQSSEPASKGAGGGRSGSTKASGGASSSKRKRSAPVETKQPEFLFGLPKKKIKKAPVVSLGQGDASKGASDEVTKIAQVKHEE